MSTLENYNLILLSLSDILNEDSDFIVWYDSYWFHEINNEKSFPILNSLQDLWVEEIGLRNMVLINKEYHKPQIKYY